jgi:REP element-mobilizing transposase RayT
MPSPRNFLRNLADVKTRTRGYVTHWEQPDATYSVTFRLHDSLPRGVIAQLVETRELIERSIDSGSLTAAEAMIARRELERRLDEALDRHEGHAYMRDERVAEIVAGALTYFEAVRYRLYAWCVMPNHVHAVVQPLGAWPLARILQSWKSYSSKKANAVLGRDGRFWQKEYFNRIVRDEADLTRTIEYVVGNPAKSGLMEWPFVSDAGWKPAERPTGRRRYE